MLLEVNCNQTKSTPKNLYEICDFWMYSVNLGVLIHQSDNRTLLLSLFGPQLLLF